MKKAMAFLSTRSFAYEFIVSEGGRGQQPICRTGCRAGWEKLLNTRGMMWKKLGDAQAWDVDKGQRALALMAVSPA